MLYEDEFIYIEREVSQVPWLKIFTKEIYKEFSHCPTPLQKELFETILLCERALLEFYQPEKINIASFANYVPRVHFHIMARFKEDAFFPECMWGKQQREMKELDLPKFEDFEEFLRARLKN